MRPYTPLELVGRNIYVREGCYLCHSQQIRPFKDEVERYGHYSLAAESMYDQPFQWGSKRTGPTWRGSAAATRTTGMSPICSTRARSCRKAIMPAYPFLAETQARVRRHRRASEATARVGVPYTDEMIANARADSRRRSIPTPIRRRC